MILFLVSCTSNSVAVKTFDSSAAFSKICITGSGKGRIELVANKFAFAYESEINFKSREFNLVFDFPIIGEKKMVLSLDPKIAAKKIGRSQMLRILESQIGDRTDKDVILQGIEEFFVLTSEFVQYRAANKFPSVYNFSNVNDHFILKREHGNYVYEVDSYALNENFFERVVIKINSKDNLQNGAFLTLFLVPEVCEK